MKSIYTLAVIAALGLVSARADHDTIGSPKFQEMNRHALTGGTEVTQKFEFVRGNKNALERVVGMASKDERNLVREQREVVYTGKNPLRDAQKQFEIAPVR